MADDKDKKIGEVPHLEELTGDEKIPVSADGQPRYVEALQIAGLASDEVYFVEIDHGGNLVATKEECAEIYEKIKENKEAKVVLVDIDSAGHPRMYPVESVFGKVGPWPGITFIYFGFSYKYTLQISPLSNTIVNGGLITVEEIAGKFYIETTWEGLKFIRDNSDLQKGCWYRIVDYQCTTTQDDTISAGHQFDILVLATDVNKLSEEARAIQHQGDTYFANNKLEAWKIWYCLDNDVTRFLWADVANGRGVIYRMIDEFQNDVPYDFKNIKFERCEATHSTVSDLSNTYIGIPGISQSGIIKGESQYNKYAYTFCKRKVSSSTVIEAPDDVDASLENIPGYGRTSGRWYSDHGCTNNVIKPYYITLVLDDIRYSVQRLNDIVFLTNNRQYSAIYVKCYANVFGVDCHDSTFIGDTYNNTFGSYCYQNNFGNGCYSNKFGNNCCFNALGAGCYFNDFGDYCESNAFKTGCVENFLMDSFKYNILDDNCTRNAFGIGCYSNSLKTQCYGNTFGSGCTSNSLGGYCTYNSFGNYCRENTFDYYCSNNTFGNLCQGNRFSNHFVSNTIGNGCCSNDFRNVPYIQSSKIDDGVLCIRYFSTSTPDSANYIQNIHILRGVLGSYANYAEITFNTLGSKCEICYGYTSQDSDEIESWITGSR